MIECYTVQMLKKLNEETGALIHWCCIFSRIIESMKNSFLFLYILFHIFQSSRLADALDARTSHQIEISSRLTSDRNQLGPHIRQEPARTLRSKAITAKIRRRWFQKKMVKLTSLKALKLTKGDINSCSSGTICFSIDILCSFRWKTRQRLYHRR